MPRFQRLSPLLITVATALTLIGCGGGNDTPTSSELSKELCFDNSVYALGASYKLNFKEGAGNLVVSGSVLSTNANFNGASNLIEFLTRTETTVTSSVTQYLKPLAPGIAALYGTKAALGAVSFITTTYGSPYEDRRAELAVGQTRTFVGQGIRDDMFRPGPVTFTQENQIKFVGVERITMPAGTFTACRYEVNGTTEWWHRSLVIRRDFNNGEPRVLQSGELNGTPLKNQ
ncbi:hypothetical protein [Acidovorax sp.]|uniref:hypothetical protein n=1 Tax=Acidovorax sp. TaxID=1872122 RepID=UPI00260E79DF|nr:hypothetical protein [Acidovorax sp.]